MVLEDERSEEEAIAALLHDAIKDQREDRIHQEISVKFGDKIARILEGCTESNITLEPLWKEN